jgi:ATP-dependent Clp protease ATP-binding subunit ClpC
VIIMTSMFGASPFDDLIDQLLRGDPSDGTTPRRPVRRGDLSRPMSEEVRELVRRAAEQAALSGSPDLGTEHLLWAATQLPSTRLLLDLIGVDADALAQRMEHAAEKDGPAPQAPGLTPAAERALIDAHNQARTAGASHIGPEHILLAVANDPDTTAGRALHEASERGERRPPPWPADQHNTQVGPSHVGPVRARPHRRSP